MFPYRVDIEKKSIPFVTISFIALNVLAFLLVLRTSDPAAVFQQYGWVPSRFEPITSLTSLFLHGGWWHLVGNMWFLWLFGSNLEEDFGGLLYPVFYLAGGVLGDVVHAVSVEGAAADIPCVGASGAISAILGAYVVIFPTSRVRCVFFFFFRLVFVNVSAFLFVGLWFLMHNSVGYGLLVVTAERKFSRQHLIENHAE